MANFDERSGTVPSKTQWGEWWQTIDEVCIVIDLPEVLSAKEIKCNFKPKQIQVVVRGKTIIQGELTDLVHADDVIWTLEDGKQLRICLPKSLATPEKCWKSLLMGQYEADALTYDQMEQKMTLERFQSENPGFDFSDASVSGNYHGGGPKLTS